MAQWYEFLETDETARENPFVKLIIIDIHDIIEKEFDFPDYYGCNWSALWDSLTDMYGESIHIEILGLENIKNRFGEETVDKMIEIFERFKHFEKSFENV